MPAPSIVNPPMKRFLPYIQSSGVVIGGRITSQISQLILLVIAARYLDPADFGRYTLCFIFAQTLFYIGIGAWKNYVLIKHTVQEHAAATACTLGVAVLSGVILLLAALMTQLVAGMADAAILLCCIACWVVASILTNLQHGFLTRQEKVQQIEIINIAAELVALGVSVVLLEQGLGIIALGIGKIAHGLICWLGTLHSTPWLRLIAAIERQAIRDCLHYSTSIIPGRIANSLSANIVVFVSGFALGTYAAGILRAALRITSAACDVLAAPAYLYSWILAKRNAPGIEQERIILILAAVTVPALSGLCLLGTPIVSLLLGPDWVTTGFIITLLALPQLYRVLDRLTEPLFSSARNERLLTRHAMGLLFIRICVILPSLWFGLIGITIGTAISLLLCLGVVIYSQHRFSEVNWHRLTKSLGPIFAASALMVLILFLTCRGSSINPNSWVALISASFIGTLTYVALLAMFYSFPYFKRNLVTIFKPA